MEILAESVNELGGDVGVVVRVNLADGLFGVPRGLDLVAGIAGAQQAEELGATGLAEPLISSSEQSPDPIQRIVLAASVAEGLVLDPAAALVQLGVREADHVERVGDLGGVGQHRVVDRPVRSGQIQGRPADPAAPLVASSRQPRRGAGAVTARDHVKKPSGTDVDDAGRPVLAPPRSLPGEQRLVENRRGDLTDAVRVVHELLAVGHHGVVHGVPVAAQIRSDLVDGAAALTDLASRPPSRPIGHPQPPGPDPGLLGGPRPHRTRRLSALPAVLAPQQPSWPAERRQIHQLHYRPVLHPGSYPAAAAPRPSGAGFDVNPDRLSGVVVVDAEDVDVGESHEQLAHANRVSLHRGPPALTA